MIVHRTTLCIGFKPYSYLTIFLFLQALVAEIEACKERCGVVCKKGSQLISEGNSFAEEIGQLIVDLQSSVEKLRKLAETRAERLNEAAQSFQVSVNFDYF